MCECVSEIWLLQAVLCVHHYYANKGEEYFISMETPDHKHVYGFLKLRLNEVLHIKKNLINRKLI